MEQLIQRFNVRGYCISRGIKFKHEGQVSLYPDRKLLGLINTHNLDGSENTQLFLGLYDGDDSSLLFLKLPIISSKISPSFFSLTSETLQTGDLIGDYKGFWANIGKLILPKSLIEIVSHSPTIITPELESFSAEEFRNSYFYPNIVYELEGRGAYMNLRGTLGFQRIDSLSRMVQTP